MLFVPRPPPRVLFSFPPFPAPGSVQPRVLGSRGLWAQKDLGLNPDAVTGVGTLVHCSPPQRRQQCPRRKVGSVQGQFTRQRLRTAPVCAHSPCPAPLPKFLEPSPPGILVLLLGASHKEASPLGKHSLMIRLFFLLPLTFLIFTNSSTAVQATSFSSCSLVQWEYNIFNGRLRYE